MLLIPGLILLYAVLTWHVKHAALPASARPWWQLAWGILNALLLALVILNYPTITTAAIGTILFTLSTTGLALSLERPAALNSVPYPTLALSFLPLYQQAVWADTTNQSGLHPLGLLLLGASILMSFGHALYLQGARRPHSTDQVHPV